MMKRGGGALMGGKKREEAKDGNGGWEACAGSLEIGQGRTEEKVE